MIDADTYTWIGAAMIASQRVEFLTHGLVAHYKYIGSDRQFANLTPKIFLDNSPQAKKIRKQTLGQIFRMLKQHTDLSLIDKLDIYLENRNLLIHELWRQYFRDDIEVSNNEVVIHFCKEFIADSTKIENFYKGFLYAMAKSVASLNNLDIPDKIKKFEDKYNYFIICLNNKDFI